MKNRLIKNLSLVLAGTLQLMPLMRSMLPTATQGLLPTGGAILFRWGVGAAAMFGYHAISSASSIAISPPNATVGQPYIGTITYSGGHAGSVRSMAFTNDCLASAVSFLPGLTIAYNGGNTATVSGTPTAATNYTFGLRIYSSSTCGSGDSDARSATLAVGASGGGGVAPAFSSAPQSICAQVGSDALLSAAASGTPAPRYYWRQGPTTVLSTSNSLYFRSVTLANSGLYTVTASNASGTVSTNCFLSVCLTPGQNQLALNYTNYHPVSNAVMMTSFLTNVPSGSNIYKWQYNFVDVTPYSTSGSNFTVGAAQATAGRSGTYSVVFNSVYFGTGTTNVIVPQQQYYSYWAFGSAPSITANPESTNAQAGSDVTLTVSARVAATPYTNQSLHFDWYLNNNPIPVSGQDGLGTNQTSSLTLQGIGAGDQGAYSVVISDYWGSVTSSPANLTIIGLAMAPGIASQPSPQTIIMGQNAAFSITATGTDPLNYQWQKDGLDLSDGGVFSGVNSSVLNLTGVGMSEQGNYSVIITNIAGSTNSAGAMLTVLVPPIITSEPLPQTVVAGQNTSFNVVASGSSPLSYHWQKGGADLADGGVYSGVTTPMLTLTGVQTGNAGSYSVLISNAAGSANSVGAVLTVNIPPGISSQPSSQTVVAGQNASFSVGASGTELLSYQWQKDGADLSNGGVYSGVTTPALSITGVRTNDAGSYSVFISNSAGSTNSAGATLTVNVPPIITSEPALQSVFVGQNASFSVAAIGTDPLSYQWQKDGVSLTNGGVFSGATTNILSLTGVGMQDQGNYSVVITNIAGATNSASAALNVATQSIPPAITLQPLPQAVLIGQGASFTVAATGTEPLSYQWQKDGVDLLNGSVFSGVTTTMLTITAIDAGQAGNYSVFIQNDAGSTNCNPAALTVVAPPTLALNFIPGNNLVLSATTVPGIIYVVQTTSDVTPPVAWDSVITNTAASNGLIQFTNSAGSRGLFLRLLFP